MENNSGKVSAEKAQELEAQVDKKEPPVENPVAVAGDTKGLTFSVQFYASAVEEKNSKFSALSKENITFVKENGMYKYRLGPYSTLDEATKKQTFARENGYKDAFVIAINDGKRISIEEAKAIAKK